MSRLLRLRQYPDRHSISPFPTRLWGFSLVDPGLGPLDKPTTRVAKSIWDFDGVVASSRHLPGVSFCGRPHCGVIGTAPSRELMQRWEKRENNINDRYASHGHVCAQMATSVGAYVGQDLASDLMQKIYSEGARTKPAREHGGNIDSASLTRGSKIYLVSLCSRSLLISRSLCMSPGQTCP